MIQRPRALVLSPSASHPQDYGNRNRVWQVTSFLKKLGYSVDFLLYPFEAEWTESIPPEANAMRLAWDSFWVVPPSKELHARAEGDYHLIDEWWDPAIGTFLEWLFSRRSYDLFVVNYTFLSQAFTYAPKTTLRVLETHDVFTGRKEILAALGVGPEFFYTTSAEEKTAFDRADIVVAIKESEAALIRSMTDRRVVSLPFYNSRTKVSRRRDTGFAGLSIGFIGAGNSINVANFQAFFGQFDPMVRLYCPPLRVIVAGNVCRYLEIDNPAFESLGRVEDINDFYAKVDVVVAPIMFSTGLKIKVAEALAHGKGVVSTVNGFDGFPATDEMHTLPGIAEVCRALIKIAFDRKRRDKLVSRSHAAAQQAQQATERGFRTLATALQEHSPRIVFVTDRPYWGESGFRAMRLVQWAQLCGFLTRMIVCRLRSVGDGEQAFDMPGDIFEIDVPEQKGPTDIDRLAAKLDRALRRIGRAEIVLSVEQPWAKGLFEGLVKRGHAPMLDLWCEPLADVAQRAGALARADVCIVRREKDGAISADASFETMPMRWEPGVLRDWADRPTARRVAVVCTSEVTGRTAIEAELRWALRNHDSTCELIAVENSEDDVEALYSWMESGARPLLLLSVGGSVRLARAGLMINECSGVPFVAIDSHTFPMALSDKLGGITIADLIGTLASRIVEMLDYDTGPYLGGHAMDTGWSSYWKTSEDLLERHRSSPGDEGRSSAARSDRVAVGAV